MFKAKGIESGYGEVTVLRNLDFEVGDEIFAVLGANGAGKSTLLKTIARVLALKSGSMSLDGQDVSSISSYKLAEMGVAYVPQEHNVFPDLTVSENLSLGGIVTSRAKRKQIQEEIFEMFPDIVARLNQKAGTLSGGETQMVAIGRALMQEPSLLLLDEPTAGLAPIYVDNLFVKIKEIHENRNVSVVLAEQNATKTLKIADRVMILSLGEIFLIEDSDKVNVEQLKDGYRI